MLEERKIRNEDFVDSIKNIIGLLHPYKEPRRDFEEKNYNLLPQMGIELYLCDNDAGNIETQVMFLDGNNYAKSSIDTSYFVNGIISTENIKELIDFLLDNYPIISNFNYYGNNLSIDFVYDLADSLKYGINCEKISLNITSRMNELSYIIYCYYKYILETYYYKLGAVLQKNDNYRQAIEEIKNELIDKMTCEEMLAVISMFSKEKLQNILNSIDSETFINKYYSKANEKIKVKVLEKVERFNK